MLGDPNVPRLQPKDLVSSPSEVNSAVALVSVVRVSGASRKLQDDSVAVEEPLEIRLAWGEGTERVQKSVSITMRTPGNDLELAVGFLVSEGIVRARADVSHVTHCGPTVRPDGTSNIVRVELTTYAAFDSKRLERHFYTTSSCGICGKTSLEAVRTSVHPPIPLDSPRLSASVVHDLPARLRAAQDAFARTGGLHAAGLFDNEGNLLSVREDVGRHNAVDKVVGAELLAGELPRNHHVLMVSGRASFELVQKAVMAGIPVLAAVGAPSSLAIELAHEENLTVIGFVREGRFNIYTGEHRVQELVSEDVEP